MNRSKVAALVAAAVIGTSGASIATAGPVAAQSRGCATPGEYGRVHHGMTRHRVGRILHQHGQAWIWSRGANMMYQVRRYRTCSGGRISVGFAGYAGRPLRMAGKKATW